MRISDWSSDVCSSDLGIGNHLRAARGIIAAPLFRAVPLGNDIGAIERVIKAAPARVRRVQRIAGVGERHDELRPGESRDFRVHTGGADGKRAEEHTAELQSLKRISYAVFCLKKKKNRN